MRASSCNVCQVCAVNECSWVLKTWKRFVFLSDCGPGLTEGGGFLVFSVIWAPGTEAVCDVFKKNSICRMWVCVRDSSVRMAPSLCRLHLVGALQQIMCICLVTVNSAGSRHD